MIEALEKSTKVGRTAVLAAMLAALLLLLAAVADTAQARKIESGAGQDDPRTQRR